MKPGTMIWLGVTNIGRPAESFKKRCTTREAIMTLAEYLTGAYMGQKIRIVLARAEEDLDESRKSTMVRDMMDELESLVPPIDGNAINASES